MPYRKSAAPTAAVLIGGASSSAARIGRIELRQSARPGAQTLVVACDNILSMGHRHDPSDTCRAEGRRRWQKNGEIAVSCSAYGGDACSDQNISAVLGERPEIDAPMSAAMTWWPDSRPRGIPGEPLLSWGMAAVRRIPSYSRYDNRGRHGRDPY